MTTDSTTRQPQHHPTQSKVTSELPRVPQLVVGDDGSPAADVVWLWVNNHQWPGWRISILTARVPEPGPPVGAERAAPHAWEPATPRILLNDQGSNLEHLLAECDPRIAFDSCADATLIAIGPRGRGLLKRLHIGTTAEWLIGAHRPLTPVVIVRSARPTWTILACVDGSHHAQAAVHALTQLPWLSDCQVSILGVSDDHHRRESDVEEATVLLEGAGAQAVKPLFREALAHTSQFDVRSTVLATLAEESPDLVAVGARGRGGVRGLMIGSVASAVVHQAPCSVLVGVNTQH